MDNKERRNEILDILLHADGPVTGMSLSKAMNVTRQIIVGDVALLRSGGIPIVSTARGYLLEKGNVLMDRIEKEISCHNKPVTLEKALEEMFAIVDNGGVIRGIAVDNPAYGPMKVKLNLHSRRDVRRFNDIMAENEAPLLSSLHKGIHTLWVEAGNQEDMQAIEEALAEADVLVK